MKDMYKREFFRHDQAFTASFSNSSAKLDLPHDIIKQQKYRVGHDTSPEVIIIIVLINAFLLHS